MEYIEQVPEWAEQQIENLTKDIMLRPVHSASGG